MASEAYDVFVSETTPMNACSVETHPLLPPDSFVCGLYQLNEEEGRREGGLLFYQVSYSMLYVWITTLVNASLS